MRTIDESKVDKKILALNSHWSTSRVDTEYTKLKKRRYFRLFFEETKKFDVARAIILMGPRRVGKTVMLMQTIDELINSGIPAADIAYFSLDEPLFYSMSIDDLIDKYKALTNKQDITNSVIIFDEIQYLKDWSVQLKIQVDHNKKTKIIASGSAAGALRRQSKESGAGRFSDFMLPPMTFCEYLDMLDLTNELLIFSETGKATAAKDIGKLNSEFLNYLNYGGFPEAIVNHEIRQNPQKFIRQDIIEKVLLRDLPSLYGIENIQELNRLFNSLSYQTGNEVSYEALSKSSGIAKNTIKRYIEYLEAAFLIRVVNRVSEDCKTFKRANFIKVYLTNPSMYAASWGLVTEDDTEALGGLVETAIFSQWMHESSSINNIYYASLKPGEVDLVCFDQKFKISWCMEVKWSDLAFEAPSKLNSLKKFIRKNNSPNITVTTKSKNGVKQIEGQQVYFKETAIVCFNIGNSLLNRKNSK